MINQPDTIGNIPEALEKQLQNVRSEILIGEQKVKQLEGAQRQISAEIRAALQTKAEIISLNETLTIQRDALNKKIDEENITLADIKSQVIDAANVLEKTIEFTKEKEQVINERDQNSASEKAQLESEKEAHAETVQKFEEEKKKHEDKVKRLQEALS